jgi:hypothetical protein
VDELALIFRFLFSVLVESFLNLFQVDDGSTA